MEKPIFIYFLIYGCPDCKPYFPIWKEIVKKYDNNENFILAEADCRIHRILRKIYHITWVPSFMTIYKNQSNLEYIESNIESMTKVISKIEKISKLSMNHNNFTDNSNISNSTPNLPKCQKIGKQIVNYPSYVVGDLISDPCQKIEEFQQKYPHIKYNFYYMENNQTKGFIALRPGKIIEFEDNTYSDDFDSFIHEFTFPNGGDWNLSETKNISRRIGFFIYRIQDQISSYQPFMKTYDSYILFGKIHYDEFRRLFPSVRLTNNMIPALAISNKEKTKFTILNNRRGYNRLMRTIISGNAERMMKNSLRPIYPDIKREDGMLIGLIIMSFSVIFFTFYLIWMRARKCINMNGIKPLKNNAFL